MTFSRKKMPVTIFVVVQLYVAHISLAEKFITLVHFDTERAENRLSLRSFLHDGIGLLILLIGSIRKNGQIMVEQLVISRKFHHLRVDENQLEFRRMFRVQERGYQHIKANRLTLFGSTGDKKMRCVSEIEYLHFLSNGEAHRYRKFSLAFPEGSIIQKRFKRHSRRSIVRDLDTYGIRQHDDTHTLRVQRHGDFPVEILDRRNLHALGRDYLIKGYGRTYNSLNLVYADFICLESSANLIVIAHNLLLRDIMDSIGIVTEKIQCRELVILQFVPHIDSRKFFLNICRKSVAFDDLHILRRILGRSLIWMNRLRCS